MLSAAGAIRTAFPFCYDDPLRSALEKESAKMTNGRAAQTDRKGLSPVVWIAIGCAGVLVLAGIATMVAGVFIFNKAKDVVEEMEDDPVLATSKLIAAANPDVELVGVDEENRTVTFLNSKTGEEFTFHYRDIEEGKFSFTSEEGTYDVDASGEEGRLTVTTDEGTAILGSGVSLEKFPGWLPVYPGTSPEGTFFTESPEGHMGAYIVRTPDDLETVMDYYVAELETAGLEMAQRTTMPSGAVLIANSPDDARTVSITGSVEGGEVKMMVNFTEKKD
jgi:hypothetical protein